MRDGRTHLVLGLAVLITALATPAARAADDVFFDVTPRDTLVGVPVQATITIVNGQDWKQPVFPELDGASVQVARPTSSTRTTVINGRVSRQETVRLTYTVTPTVPGALEIPSFVIEVDGKTLESDPVVVLVSDCGADDLLKIQVVGTTDVAFVGQQIRLALEVWIKPFAQPPQIRTLDEASMWSCIRPEKSNWGAFRDAVQAMLTRRPMPPVRKERVLGDDGRRQLFYVYRIESEVWASSPGAADIGDVRVLMEYPRRLVRNRDVFSRTDWRIAESTMRCAVPTTEPLEVLAIPEAGRPELFADAVGRFSIHATATPVDVAVGDPITVTLNILDETPEGSRLDVLQAPPLHRFPALADAFAVPADRLAGTVSGTMKTFEQTIRPKRDTVTEIPALPFSFFDPAQERFVTVMTKPIPITVAPAKRMSMSSIVEADNAGPAGRTSLTEVSGGILANYTDPDQLLASQSVRLGWPVALAVAAPPLLYALFFVGWRRASRLRTDTAWARARRANARAMRRLGDARRLEAGERTAAVAELIGTYVADRCDLPAGGLTRTEVLAALDERSAGAEVIAKVDQLLGNCEQAQFAPTNAEGDTALLEEARSCLAALERCRFARGRRATA